MVCTTLNVHELQDPSHEATLQVQLSEPSLDEI